MRQTLKPTLSTHLKVLPVLTVLHTEAVREGLAANSLATRGFGSFSHTLHRQIPAQPGSGASRFPPSPPQPSKPLPPTATAAKGKYLQCPFNSVEAASYRKRVVKMALFRSLETPEITSCKSVAGQVPAGNTRQKQTTTLIFIGTSHFCT